MPIALPRSPGGYTDVMIARLVPKIIALDNPCKMRNMMSEVMLPENIIRNVERVKSTIPVEKIFFLPRISASLPKGRRNIAEAKMKLLITHPSSIAFALRSFPIEGNARFTADPRKGVRNAANVATSRTDLFEVFSSDATELITD
jgi:hypothetical protein